MFNKIIRKKSILILISNEIEFNRRMFKTYVDLVFTTNEPEAKEHYMKLSDEYHLKLDECNRLYDLIDKYM